MALRSHDNTTLSKADWDLVATLLETLENEPDNVEAMKLLAVQYSNQGWDDAATELMQRVSVLSPTDIDATAASSSQRKPPGSSGKSKARIFKLPNITTRRKVDPHETISAISKLRLDYTSLRSEAKGLVHEMEVFQTMRQTSTISGQIAAAIALAEGRMLTTAQQLIDQSGSLETDVASIHQKRARMPPQELLGQSSSTQANVQSNVQSLKSLAFALKSDYEGGLSLVVEDLGSQVSLARSRSTAIDAAQGAVTCPNHSVEAC
jgi:hypothetical protein